MRSWNRAADWLRMALYVCIMQAANNEIKEHSEACRRLYILESRYSEEMTVGILQFVRPLHDAVLSQSGYNTLFQNVEKVHMLIIALYSKLNS